MSLSQPSSSPLLLPALLLLAKLLQGMAPASSPSSSKPAALPALPPAWRLLATHLPPVFLLADGLSWVLCPGCTILTPKLPTWNVVSWIVLGANIPILLPALRTAFKAPAFPAKGAWFTAGKGILCFRMSFFLSWANLKLLKRFPPFSPHCPHGWNFTGTLY